MRAAFLLCCVGALTLADGHVVEQDGSLHRGSVELAGADIRVGKRTIPRARVFLAEREDGTFLYAPDLAARVRGYERIANTALQKQFERLASKALYMRDFPLALRAIAAAEDAGLASRRSATLKRKLEAQRKKGKGRVDEKLRAESDRLERHVLEFILGRAKQAQPDDPHRLALLREVLRREPRHVGAKKLVGTVAAKKFPLGGARTWLDWHLDIEQPGGKLLFDGPLVEAFRGSWRDDLHAVYRKPIAILTPVRDSRIVSRCLTVGRLACDALAAHFKTDKPARTPQRPMTVLLYENKEEYTSVSGTGREVRDAAMLEFTAGHYTPGEGITRFFWHADTNAERRIVGTCIHELTHHWLQEHNPCVVPDPRNVTLPGFWIIEGIATFMEEGLYDIDRQTWDLFNPRAGSLDVLNSVNARALIPWGRFYAGNAGLFHALPPDNQNQVSLRWRLFPRILSTRRLFYEQAGATCHFLYHAEDGKYRAALIRFVNDYYAGRRKRLSCQSAFGLSGAELGKRVVAFAKAVQQGWRPKRKATK